MLPLKSNPAVVGTGLTRLVRGDIVVSLFPPMPSYIDMPSLSDTMTEGTLLKWRIKPGDKVTSGQIIADIQTDKATMEMEAFDDGIVHKLYLTEGDKVPLGAPMAILIEEGEAPPADDSPPHRPTPAQDEGDWRRTRPFDGSRCGRRTHATCGVRSGAHFGREDQGLAAGPQARRGTRYQPRRARGKRARRTNRQGRCRRGPLAWRRPRFRPSGDPPCRRTRRHPGAVDPDAQIIAQRLLASKTQIPHFYLHIEVDAAPLMASAAQANAAEEKKGTGDKFTVNDFILKAVAGAATQVPAVNAAFDGDAIVRSATSTSASPSPLTTAWSLR